MPSGVWYCASASREPIIIFTIVSTTGASLLHVIRVHSRAMSSEPSVQSHASRPHAYRFACAKWLPVRLSALPRLATPTIAVSAALAAPSTILPTSRLRPALRRLGLEHLLPHRREVGEHPVLARVLLGDLQLDRLVGVLHAPEHRVDRFARLEVQRPVLGLQEHVVGERAASAVVDRAELEERALEPVVVDVGVVDERAPEHHHAQRRDARRRCRWRRRRGRSRSPAGPAGPRSWPSP